MAKIFGEFLDPQVCHFQRKEQRLYEASITYINFNPN